MSSAAASRAGGIESSATRGELPAASAAERSSTASSSSPGRAFASSSALSASAAFTRARAPSGSVVASGNAVAKSYPTNHRPRVRSPHTRPTSNVASVKIFVTYNANNALAA